MQLCLPGEQGALTHRCCHRGAARGLHLELKDWSQHSKRSQDPPRCSVLISFQPMLCWLTGEKAVDSSLKSNNFFFPIALWLGCTYKSELIYGLVCMHMSMCACVVCLAGCVWLHVCVCACVTPRVMCVWVCVCLSVW